MLSQDQLDEIRVYFQSKFDSLERDSYRAFTHKIEIDHKLGSGAAPFPITLFCMSTLDFFSSAYCGYSEVKRIKGRIEQTPRMINFLTKYLGYDEDVSKQAIKIFRHSLVHLSEPMPTKTLGWEIASNQADGDHWTIQMHNLQGDKSVRFGVNDFIGDLKNGVMGPDGYYSDLNNDGMLQQKYLDFLREVKN